MRSWAENVARIIEIRNAYNIPLQNPEGKGDQRDISRSQRINSSDRKRGRELDSSGSGWRLNGGLL
jgi:hypothetical protein